jgi:L-iditol 2-dehydrogenase
MKAVKWYAPRDLRMSEMEKPVPKPHEALIRIESTGVCGSDIHYYVDGRIGDAILTEPLVLGHEYAGRVEDVGSQVDPSLVGKRVAVEPGIPCLECEFCKTGHYNVCRNMTFPGMPPNNGALCEYIAVHADFCFPVPESMPGDIAGMIEPVAVAYHTVELANLKPGETAAICGLGPIGLLTAMVARLAGVGVMFGTDLHDYRVEYGKQFGVDVAFNADKEDTVERIMRETDGRGVDVAFDCARSSETPGIACKVVRPAGRVVLTGISGTDADLFPVNDCRRKELNLQWCRRFRFNYPAVISLISRGQLDVRPLITHNYSLEESQKAFEVVTESAENVLKASIDQ